MIGEKNAAIFIVFQQSHSRVNQPECAYTIRLDYGNIPGARQDTSSHRH